MYPSANVDNVRAYDYNECEQCSDEEVHNLQKKDSLRKLLLKRRCK